MGWCSGSYMAEDIYNKIRKYIPKSENEIAKTIYDIFCQQDADCWDYDMNIIKDAKLED